MNFSIDLKSNCKKARVARVFPQPGHKMPVSVYKGQGILNPLVAKNAKSNPVPKKIMVNKQTKNHLFFSFIFIHQKNNNINKII